MKLTVDLNDPNDVASATDLLVALTRQPAAQQAQATAAPAPAPAPAAPPAPAPAPAAPPAPAPAPALAPAAPPAPAPAPAAPPPPAQPAPAPAPAPAPGSITQAEFAAKVQAYAKAHGPKAAKNFLASKGFANTQAVTPDWFPHLIAEMGV